MICAGSVATFVPVDSENRVCGGRRACAADRVACWRAAPAAATLAMVLAYPDPPLDDGSVVLRRWEPRDVDCVRLAGTDPRIPRGTSVPAVFSPSEGLAFIQRQWDRQTAGEGLSLAIEPLAGEGAVGLLVALLRPQPDVVGLGYWIIPDARGHGHAGRAVRLLSRWLLDQTPTRRVEALVEPENGPSRRTLERCGFHEEGRLRSYLDGRHDAIMYSLIAGDCVE